MLYTAENIQKKKQRVNKIKRYIDIVMYVILIPLLIYNSLLIIQAIIMPEKTFSFLGMKAYTIISGSMEPNLNIGDIVIINNIKEEKLNVGDIISFREGRSVVTHRILDIESNGEKKRYKTKGDNNNREDSGTIGFDSIEGKVIKKIPYIGRIALLLQDKMAIIIVGISIYVYIAYSNSMKKKKLIRKNIRLEYERKKKFLEEN